MNIILEVNGGLGKSIMATAVASKLKEQGNVIVVSMYPEVFTGLGVISVKHGTPWFYETYVRGQEVKIHRREPYFEEAHILGKEHLIKTWFDICGLEYRGEMPVISLTPAERLEAGKTCLFQPYGGANPSIKYSWNRDMPPRQAKEVADRLRKTYKVYQIKSPEQPLVEGCEPLTRPLREVFAMIRSADRLVLIDSFAQHAAAALGREATVCWITNSPKVFGYDMHENLQAREPDKDSRSQTSYLQEFDFTGSVPAQYLWNDDNLFNIDEI